MSTQIGKAPLSRYCKTYWRGLAKSWGPEGGLLNRYGGCWVDLAVSLPSTPHPFVLTHPLLHLGFPIFLSLPDRAQNLFCIFFFPPCPAPIPFFCLIANCFNVYLFISLCSCIMGIVLCVHVLWKFCSEISLRDKSRDGDRTNCI